MLTCFVLFEIAWSPIGLPFGLSGAAPEGTSFVSHHASLCHICQSHANTLRDTL